MHPADRATVERGWREAIRAVRPSTGDYRFLHPDGRTVWVNGLATPEHDAAGRCTGWIGTITDVTARVEAEALLAAQRDVLELVVSGAPLADTMDHLLRAVEQGDDDLRTSLLVLDDDRRRVRTLAAPRLPAAYCQAIDGSEIGPVAGSCGTAAWLGMEVITEDIAADPKWDAWRPAALAHGLRACWSTPIFDRDGTVLGTFAMYFSEPRQPTPAHRRTILLVSDLAALAIIRDREQRALRESEARFRGMFEQAAVGVALLSPDGTYLNVNERFAAIAGVPSAQIVGSAVGLLADASEAPTNRRLLEDIVSGRLTLHRMDRRLVRPDGGVVWTVMTASPIRNTSGVVELVAVVVEDVTATRQLEHQLAEAQKFEALGMLAGGVAHDFNNLLSIVMGHAEAAQQEVGEHPVRGDLEAILEAARHGAEVTRQLLAFARRETTTPVAIDVNARLASLRRMLERILREEIVLELVLEPQLWPVLMDPTQFDQVMINLVSNARDAIQAGGTVRIETTNLEAGAGWIVIRVSDTGHGMDAVTLRQAFEPFFTTKPRGRGTGLGLPVVRGVVEKSGGAVSIDSAPGDGTVITIRLPRCDGTVERAAPEAPLAEATATRPAVILVVEDEPTLLNLEARTLERRGHRVLTADGPAKALELIARHTGPLDLLLTDVVMPGMSGPELAVMARATHPDLRVLFMSGYPADVVTARGELPANTDYVQKPFTVSELLERVRMALERAES